MSHGEDSRYEECLVTNLRNDDHGERLEESFEIALIVVVGYGSHARLWEGGLDLYMTGSSEDDL